MEGRAVNESEAFGKSSARFSPALQFLCRALDRVYGMPGAHHARIKQHQNPCPSVTRCHGHLDDTWSFATKKADKVPTAFAPGLPSVGNEAFSLPHLSLRALLGMRYSHVSAMIATLHASSALVVDPSAAINGPVSVRPTAAARAGVLSMDSSWRRSYDGRGGDAAVLDVTAPGGAPEILSPSGTPFPVGGDGPTWKDERTGTSFLPQDAIERAADGNPIEKAKLTKDATNAFTDVYEFAAAIRAGTLDWSEIEKMDFNTRLKWVGLVHRDKRTPGRFMMRVRLPNGVMNADIMRFYADSVEPYGPELGVIDVTTRQNIQLRGVVLEDADKIIDGLHKRGHTSLHSALDNVRNMVGSPLAGIDTLEMVDTRPFCEALNDLITLNKETGERGNPVWSNMPRKFNIAVSGGRDDYAHTHINDIGFQPCAHATTGEMGFNIVLGGYMSTKRVAESIDMNVWIPANVDCAVELSTAILRIFRDEGNRKDRQMARLMWLIESYGAVEEVNGHLRCHVDWRNKVLGEMASYGNGFEKMGTDRATVNRSCYPPTRASLCGPAV